MIDYRVEDGIAVITLNRPERRNAQTPEFLSRLNDAWIEADQDGNVTVIVLRAEGPHFSSGHDLEARDDPAKGIADQRGIENYYRFEYRTYFQYTRSWRSIPKPSIAAVQGACIAAGLMLVWPCDLIVAAENAYFSDPVLRIGVGGIEYHAHPYEFGARRAKELLFTAGKIDAAEAYRLGMVNHVVSLEELDTRTMQLARDIAQMDPFALAQAKRAVNLAMDAQQYIALEANFDNHWTGHHHASAIRGAQATPITSVADMMAANRETAE